MLNLNSALCVYSCIAHLILNVPQMTVQLRQWVRHYGMLMSSDRFKSAIRM